MNRRTAISKYGIALAGILAQGHDVTLFCEPGLDSTAMHDAPASIPIIALDRAGLRRLREQDVLHFQLGNSRFHHFQTHLAPRLRSRPPTPPVVVTLHEATIGNAIEPTCSVCIALVARNPFKMLRLTGPALRAMRQERANSSHVRLRGLVKHLPPRQLANHVWSRSVDELILHSRAVIPLLRFDAGTARISIIPPAAIGSAAPAPPGGVPNVLVPVLSLGPHRGLEMLLEAAQRVEAPFRLIMTGANNRKHPDFTERFMALANPLITSQRLRLAGALSEPEFEKALSQASVVAIPRTMTIGEVSSAILHAFAAGRPVVASNIGSFPEYVQDGRNGLLAANTVVAWADALERILKSPLLRAKLGAGALETAHDDLGQARILAAHTAVYERAVVSARA